MIIQQLSVFVENRLGRMAEITDVLASANIDIRALSIADTSDFGILRLIVDRPDDAVKALRDAEITVSLTDVIAVGIPDTPGSFAKVVRMMSEAGISIEYMYAFISRTNNKAYVIMRLENPEKGVAVMKENNVQILSGDEVYRF